MALWGKPPVTRLWRPLGGVASGALARLTEESRQATWNDAAYTEEHYYALELRGPVGPTSTLGALQNSSATFVFPLGPQSIRKSTQYRQTITPTLGGLVTEERGLAWHEITIQGNFGLSPKYGYDNTTTPAIVGDRPTAPWSSPISGPLWTRKMLANIFDRYALMKARPDENSKTVLVWHNFKDDEHFVVVPTNVELDRSVQTRSMYPFSITLRAVAKTTPTRIVKPPRTVLSTIRDAQNAVRVARRAVNVLTDSINTLTAVAGQIRYAVATIDTVVDEARRVLDATTAFVQEGERLADLGGMFLASARQTAEAAQTAAIALKVSRPREAIGAIVDTYDAIGACPEFAQTATGEERTAQTKANQASGTPADPGDPNTTGSYAARARSGATGTARTYTSNYGWKPYRVAAGDTLESIAIRELGSADAWYEIATRNGLKAPYVSAAGLPGTVRVGATLLIPSATATRKTSVAANAESDSPEALYGTDIRLFESDRSKPGRVEVDIRIDPHTGKDAATIAGVSNLVQACQMRLWTEQGTLTLDPAYGMPTTIGYPNTEANVVALRQAAQAGITGDSRIRQIQSMTITQTDDIVDIDASAVPVASSNELQLSVSLT